MHDQSVQSQIDESLFVGPPAVLSLERAFARRGYARRNSLLLARHGLAARGLRAIFFFAALFIVITAIHC